MTVRRTRASRQAGRWGAVLLLCVTATGCGALRPRQPVPAVPVAQAEIPGLLASASIPAAFPPVYFDVEAGGKRFDEMHADGGVMTQVFGAAFLARLMEMQGADAGRLYLVRNAQLGPEWKAGSPKLASIAGRTVSTMIDTQGFGDLYRAYLTAQSGRFDFNLAAIPADFGMTRTGEFDPVIMRALFDRGYQQSKQPAIREPGTNPRL